MHEYRVELNRGAQHVGLDAHALDDVPNFPRALHGGIVLALQRASRFFNRNRFNPGHRLVTWSVGLIGLNGLSDQVGQVIVRAGV